MKFREILKETVWLLLTEQCISYKRLQLEFELNDEQLETLCHELVVVKQVARDHNREFLVWSVGGRSGSLDAPCQAQTVIETSSVGSLANSEDLAPTTIEQAKSDAERRQLTVMFCDLADSTALSGQLDPEELQDVIRCYQECSTSIIHDYGGYVAKYMGDGILVYFGYPKSLERTAERAVLAALAIVEAIDRLDARNEKSGKIEVAVRIGIATGMVVVGEIVGKGLAQERTVIGEAPNIAARLQGIACRNGVVIGDLTRQLTGNSFKCDDLGPQTLKGVRDPVRAWRVTSLREGRTDSSTSPYAKNDSTAKQLYGRDEEAGLLHRAWQSTKSDLRGQVVSITGEPGIGKSALVDGLSAEVRAEGSVQTTYRCSPYHTDSALYPIVDQLKRLAGWQPRDLEGERLSKLESMLRNFDQPLTHSVPLIAPLLTLPLPTDRYSALDVSPERQKQLTQDLIITMALEAAERQPILQIWEDLHWADPSTLEILGLLIEQAPTASLLIVFTARPDFAAPWRGRSHITPITLSRLERSHTQALTLRIAGSKRLPSEVIDYVLARTDGVPLFVEELTKSILASDVMIDEDGRLKVEGTLSSVSIPATLQQSLMARLDKLPQALEIAQLGAVLGREFSYEMISGLSIIGDEALLQGLERLVDAELLYQRGRPPQARYIFKHALILDAAYESLLKRTRQEYHKRIAVSLENDFAETASSQPELVAQHYARAAEHDKAYKYWRTAAQRALSASAMVEAVRHLEAALSVLEGLPEGRPRDELELEAQMLLAPAIGAVEGYAHPPLELTYKRALELCVQLDRPVERILVLRGFEVFQMVGGRMREASNLAGQIASLVDGQDNPALRVAAAQVVGQTKFFDGDLSAALLELEKGIEIYDPDLHEVPNWPGANPGEQCYLYAALTLWMLGFRDKAIKNCKLAVEFAGRSNKFTMGNTYPFVALVYSMNKDFETTREYAEQSVALSEELGLSHWWQHSCRMIKARADIECNHNDPHTSIEDMQRAQLAYRERGASLLLPYLLCLHAEGLAKIGKPEEGIRSVDGALRVIEQTGEYCWKAMVHRTKGDLVLASYGNTPDAEKSYLDAIQVARSQQAKSWELQASIRLAELWRDQGRYSEARRMLTDVFDWFTEGFDSLDLSRAKSLLNELSERENA